ncbi:MAG: hypothetical protein K9J21_12190 [Bacteroidales bacterium]|nr:hypothetical protein [Bacteroidales bacterium]
MENKNAATIRREIPLPIAIGTVFFRFTPKNLHRNDRVFGDREEKWKNGHAFEK